MQETWETWVRSLGQENPLDEEMATHFSIQMEEPWPGRGAVVRDMTEYTCTHAHVHTHTQTEHARVRRDWACTHACTRAHAHTHTLPNLSTDVRKHFKHKSELKRLEENKQESPSEFKESSSQDSKPFAILIKTIMWMIWTKYDALWELWLLTWDQKHISREMRYPDPSAAHTNPRTPDPVGAASRSADQRPTLGPSIRRWRQALRALLQNWRGPHCDDDAQWVEAEPEADARGMPRQGSGRQTRTAPSRLWASHPLACFEILAITSRS